MGWMKRKSGGGNKLSRRESSPRHSVAVGEENCVDLRDLEELKSQSSELEKTNAKLISEIRQLKAQLNKAHEEINSHRSSIRFLDIKIWELVQKLRPDDQNFLNTHGGPSEIIQCSLREFDRLQTEILNERGSHAMEKAQEESRHSKEMEDTRKDYNLQVKTLQSEIDRLQNGLLTNVDRFQPLPDLKFEIMLTDLQKSIGDLAKSCAGNAKAGTIEEALNYIDFGIPHKHTRFLLESVFWSILVDGLFSTPFSAFGSRGKSFISTWQQLFQNQDNIPLSDSEWPEPDVASEHWRSFTFGALQQQLKAKPGSQAASREVKESYESNLHKVARRLSGKIEALSQEREEDIRRIVDQAGDMALVFGAQRCRLRLFRPQLKAIVPVKSCHNGNNGLPQDSSHGVVQFVISPGLKRFGDGRGYTFKGEVEVYKATVYLSEPGR